ncbi:MAG TPA: response regulator [Candidatus Acidoferrales bacterium]|nr:response regulator [Candidatus Acidoferrales bacterium]
MSRILLVDDSPHAQRMGERILADEGHEVVAVSNADSALIRLEDVDPDVVIADTIMPGRTGYEICQYLKMSPRHRHVRVVLTAGVLETLDEEHCQRVQADGVLKKPFEATVLLATVKPLAEAAAADRSARGPEAAQSAATSPAKPPAAPFVAVVDEEQVRAAVTVALDGAMDAIVDEITRRVFSALAAKRPEAAPAPMPLAAPIAPEPSRPAAPEPVMPAVEPVRRVTPVRMRGSSILGLDVGSHDPES